MCSKFECEGNLLDEEQQIEDAIIGLSDKGQKQAVQIGNILKEYIGNNFIKENECLILVSPYKRVRKTFELANSILNFNEKSDNIYVLNTLREQFYGAFHMISREIKKRNYGKIYDECQKIKYHILNHNF